MTDKFTVTLTEQHHLGANRLHFWSGVKSKTFIWALLRLIAIYLAVAIVATHLHNGSLDGVNWIEIVLIGVLAGLAVLGISYLIGYFTLARRSKRLFDQQKILHDPADYFIGDQSLVVKTSLSEMDFPYGYALKWVKSRDFLLIYHTDNSFQILPTEFMTVEMVNNINANLIAVGCPGRRL